MDGVRLDIWGVVIKYILVRIVVPPVLSGLHRTEAWFRNVEPTTDHTNVITFLHVACVSKALVIHSPLERVA